MKIVDVILSKSYGFLFDDWLLKKGYIDGFRS